MVELWRKHNNPQMEGKGDIIGLCTFPNSGTSWTLNLVTSERPPTLRA